MLKMAAKGVRHGKEIHLVIIGLSRENTKRLHEGKPISFDAGLLGLPEGTEIMVFAGETEQQMARDIQELVGPETRVHIDPRLRD